MNEHQKVSCLNRGKMSIFVNFFKFKSIDVILSGLVCGFSVMINQTPGEWSIMIIWLNIMRSKLIKKQNDTNAYINYLK